MGGRGHGGVNFKQEPTKCQEWWNRIQLSPWMPHC
jgi:hypothetical protein